MTTIPNILVIGGVHIDVRAVATADQYDSRTDSAGTVQYAIGGCAYNVAWNLVHNQELRRTANCRPRVSLMSAVNVNSIDGRAVLDKLRAEKIRFIELGSSTASGGYVAHVWKDGGVKEHATGKAITASAVGDVDPKIERLKKRIQDADVVYADTNLSAASLTLVALECHRLGKPLVIGVASDDKAQRILLACHETKGANITVAMNAIEAAALSTAVLKHERASSAELRKELGVGRLVLTRSSNGFEISTEKAPLTRIEAAKADAVSESGAGDALAAALCAWLSRKQVDEMNNDAFGSCVRQSLTTILACRTATPRAEHFLESTSLISRYPESSLGVATLLLVAAIWGTLWLTGFGNPHVVAAYLGISGLAGCLGALVRTQTEKQEESEGSEDPTSIARGGLAGILAAILVLVLQAAWFTGSPIVGDNSDLLKELLVKPVRPILIAAIVGTLTGLNQKTFFPWLDRKAAER